VTSVIAVDWSGAARRACRKIWLAEVRGRRLVRLENGRDRDELVGHLADRAAEGPLVVGLDFAFSFPAWFVRRHGCRSGPEVWALVEHEGERWLAACRPPFWGRPGARMPAFDPGRGPFRATEGESLAVRGIRPKPVFQIGGAGAVGTGSLRGMPHLLRLRDAGFAIWPFDPPGERTVVEIYPRELTGGLTKTNRAQRERYLREHLAGQPAELCERAAASDDAFDAAVSALRLARHAGGLGRLRGHEDERFRLEGRIWRPLVDPALRR
jgi:hypothetical protein